jgi:hypothetical protein
LIKKSDIDSYCSQSTENNQDVYYFEYENEFSEPVELNLELVTTENEYKSLILLNFFHSVNVYITADIVSVAPSSQYWMIVFPLSGVIIFLVIYVRSIVSPIISKRKADKAAKKAKKLERKKEEKREKEAEERKREVELETTTSFPNSV